jgi:hypothetical protein
MTMSEQASPTTLASTPITTPEQTMSDTPSEKSQSSADTSEQASSTASSHVQAEDPPQAEEPKLDKTQVQHDRYIHRFQLYNKKKQAFLPWDPSSYTPPPPPKEDLHNYFYVNSRYETPECESLPFVFPCSKCSPLPIQHHLSL